MNREAAFQLVCEYTDRIGLQQHMLAVEVAMRYYAQKLDADVEKWGIVGLLHDFDYQRWPDPPDHPMKGSEILRDRGYAEDIIYAIKSHADYIEDCPRVSAMDKALYACDELAGFISAVAKVRPTGIHGMKAKSVKKKMKAKGFAAAVSREDMCNGAEDFGVDFDEHIQTVIHAMTSIADDLGLSGNH